MSFFSNGIFAFAGVGVTVSPSEISSEPSEIPEESVVCPNLRYLFSLSIYSSISSKPWIASSEAVEPESPSAFGLKFV